MLPSRSATSLIEMHGSPYMREKGKISQKRSSSQRKKTTIRANEPTGTCLDRMDRCRPRRVSISWIRMQRHVCSQVQQKWYSLQHIEDESSKVQVCEADEADSLMERICEVVSRDKKVVIKGTMFCRSNSFRGIRPNFISRGRISFMSRLGIEVQSLLCLFGITASDRIT